MSTKSKEFINGGFYHVYNRGVEKREIFLEDSDYLRFIHDLYEFNDSSPSLNNNRRFFKAMSNDGGTTSLTLTKRDKLVEIICFCLTPNHYHLILKQLEEGGITRFMKKLGTGYAMYFNEKYDRVGSLFQGRFKSIFIENDEYLTHLSRYIHINSVELIEKDWQEEGIKDWQKVRKFLESYRYSSYPDYIGIKNFPSVISTDFLLGYFEGLSGYQSFVEDFVSGQITLTSSLLLE